MKTDVGTLVIVDVHGYVGARLQPFARGQLVALHVHPDNVVGLAGGHALGKLAGVIGVELPSVLFLVRPPDLHLDPVERVPVGIPNRSEDQRVRLRCLTVATLRPRGRKKRCQNQDRRGYCNQSLENAKMLRILQESSSSDSSLTTSSSSS